MQEKNSWILDKSLINRKKEENFVACFSVLLFLFLCFSGILGVGVQELFFVNIKFEEQTPKGQSSQRVSVFDDGSFTWSSDWIFDTPGEYELSMWEGADKFYSLYLNKWTETVVM